MFTITNVPRVLASACFLLAMLASLPASASEGTLRIRVLEKNSPQQIVVKGTNGSLLVYAGDGQAPIYRLAAHEEATIRARGNDLFLSLPNGDVHASSVRLLPAADALFALGVTAGRKKLSPRNYNGSLHISMDGRNGVLKLINHVGLEQYVASVITSEYGLNDLEGSKAMAVIVRTYALHALRKFGDSYDHVDHTISQVYRGADRVTPLAYEAARQTAGQVLTYNGRLIEAVYSSSSGGHTANNEDVWQAGPMPYLRGKADPYDRISPHSSWQKSVSRTKLLRVLSDAFGFSVTGIRIAERSDEGRVLSIGLLRRQGRERTLKANEFRLVFMRHFGATSLKSTFFSVRKQGSQYVFEGRGFGHGVGLSQWGAHAMAQQGYGYREILHFYYTGISIDEDHSFAARGTRATPPSPPSVGRTSPSAITAQTPSRPTVQRTSPPTRRRVGW